MHSQTEQNNANLYFVYLSSFNNYRTYLQRKFDLFYLNSPHQEAIKIVKNLNITVIDTHEDFFKKENDPLIYFPFRFSGHYNVLGYKKITEFISDKIN